MGIFPGTELLLNPSTWIHTKIYMIKKRTTFQDTCNCKKHCTKGNTWCECSLGEQQIIEEERRVAASAIRKIKIIRRDFGKRQLAK